LGRGRTVFPPWEELSEFSPVAEGEKIPAGGIKEVVALRRGAFSGRSEGVFREGDFLLGKGPGDLCGVEFFLEFAGEMRRHVSERGGPKKVFPPRGDMF